MTFTPARTSRTNVVLTALCDTVMEDLFDRKVTELLRQALLPRSPDVVITEALRQLEHRLSINKGNSTILLDALLKLIQERRGENAFRVSCADSRLYDSQRLRFHSTRTSYARAMPDYPLSTQAPVSLKSHFSSPFASTGKLRH